MSSLLPENLQRTKLANGLEFYVRPDTNDWNVVNACANEDEYGLGKEYWGSRIVFDLGAHIGGFTVQAACNGAIVIAVEPVPVNVELIRMNAALNREYDHVTAVHALVGREMGAGEVAYGFSRDANERHHSWIGNGWEKGRALLPEQDGTFIRESVDCVTLSYLVMQYGKPAAIKMDCEGGEWGVLSDPEIKNVPVIVGEWHPTVEDGRAHEMDDVFYALDLTHEVRFEGPVDGPGNFYARKRI